MINSHSVAWLVIISFLISGGVLEKLLSPSSLEGDSLAWISKSSLPGGDLSCRDSAIPFLGDTFLHPSL
jgi:hypothetical protein